MGRMLLAVLMVSAAASGQVRPPEQRDAAMKSLVVVQYTLTADGAPREVAATGVLVREDGLAIVPLLFTPAKVPAAQMKDFKLILPGREPQALAADLVHRDERYQLSFIQPRDARAASTAGFTPVVFADDDAYLGQQLRSVGLLPVQGGYRPYLSVSRVSADVPGPIPHVMVDGAGLTVIGSLVFDTKGQALGLVNDQRIGRADEGPLFTSAGHSILLNDPTRPLGSIEHFPRFYQPSTDFLPALRSLPGKDAPIQPGLAGVSELTELTRSERAALGAIDAAVRIGEIVPDSPAARAGLKPGQVIVQLDGKPLPAGTAPGESAWWLRRQLDRGNAGQKLTLGVISEPGKPLTAVDLTLAPRRP